MRIITFLAVFLLFGAFYIISEKNLYVTNNEDLSTLKASYSGWLFSAVKGAAGFVGQVVKMEWLPDVKTEEVVNETDNINSSNASGKR